MSDVEGIVASVDAKKGAKVEKGDALITVYPKDEIQIEILISEADLPTIRVGETVSIEFNWSMKSGKKALLLQSPISTRPMKIRRGQHTKHTSILSRMKISGWE